MFTQALQDPDRIANPELNRFQEEGQHVEYGC